MLLARVLIYAGLRGLRARARVYGKFPRRGLKNTSGSNNNAELKLRITQRLRHRCSMLSNFLYNSQRVVITLAAHTAARARIDIRYCKQRRRSIGWRTECNACLEN